MSKSIKMSLADIAKIKYPLVYEASLEVPDAGLMDVSEVLGAICDKYHLEVMEGISIEAAMFIMEKALEALYLTYSEEPVIHTQDHRAD